MPSIDDYDIGQLLGKGGFACVYRARHRISGENVALKVIAKSIAAAVGGPDANSISRVKNEILIHSQLRHSNIVRFMGCFEDDHNVYMILELCNYGNMFQFLRRNGPLSESIAVVVIQQLILALEYIHEHGVVHRDLKLSNILLARPDINISSYDCMNDKSFIKICDFGLAIKKEHPDEEHYTLCGTPNYIAPEIASQHAHGYPADLWSIGCLFYSLVVGTPPFEKEKGRDEESVHGNVKDTLQRILSGEYHEPVDKLSPTGVLFLRSLLHLVRAFDDFICFCMSNLLYHV
jgi:polo-like kinase 4